MNDDSHLVETTDTEHVVYKGGFLHVERHQVRLPNGHLAAREFIKHPGAVMVVPLLDHGQVVFEKQFRYPHHKSFIEFPAGKIDAGETDLHCAQRELREETGYQAQRWVHLGTIHNAIAYSDERIEIFLAQQLSAGERRLDAEEFLDIGMAPLVQVLDWIAAGQITDVKTIIGAYWTERYLRGDFPAKR